MRGGKLGIVADEEKGLGGGGQERWVTVGWGSGEGGGEE